MDDEILPFLERISKAYPKNSELQVYLAWLTQLRLEELDQS